LSSKKDKLLESAQKSILKGQIDRALKDYEQIVALDPGEMRHRQKFAELLVRVNAKEEAINQYEQIGKHYADNSYFLKAIAVYKQIQKLDPTDLKTSLTLAALNHKQGMTGNALNEYGLVLTAYETTGKYAEAIKTVDLMLELDPANPATRLRKAETVFRSGAREESYPIFCDLIRILKDQGDKTTLARVTARVAELFPEKEQVAGSQPSEFAGIDEVDAEIFRLGELLKKDSGDLRSWMNLVEAYSVKGDQERVKKTYINVLRLFPSELRAMEGLVICALDSGDGEECLNLLGQYEPNFFAQGAVKQLESIYLRLQELMPADVRIDESLNRVWGALQDIDKVKEGAGVQEFQIPDSANEQPSQEPSFQESFSSLDLDAAESPSEVVPDYEIEQDNSLSSSSLIPEEEAFDWEEEIDIGLIDEENDQVNSPPEVSAENSLAENYVTLPKDLDFESCENAEFELSLETDSFEQSSDFVETASEYRPSLEFPDELHAGADLTLELSEQEQEQEDTPPFTEWESADLDLGDESPEIDELFDQLDALLPATDGGELDNKDDDSVLDEVFATLERGSEALYDSEDLESHYDLGIAYKEMGLYDDAINEFQTAARGPRKVDSLTLQAVCYREKGAPEMAEKLLKMGSTLEGLSSGELLSFKYEMAFLYELTERSEEALRLYDEVLNADPKFHDVARRIASLKGEDANLDIIDLDLEDLEPLD
jgi:tetratricopeptide (TPR) repeat protein